MLIPLPSTPTTHSTNRLRICTQPVAQLLEHPPLLRLPLFPGPFVERGIERGLRAAPGLLDGGDDVLLVDLFDVAVDIRVLECLEGRKGRLGVEVCDGVCERGGVDVRLGKEVVSINVLST
jgi:hypothetical protein